MKLGYLATNRSTGEKLSLYGTNHPRKQLLEKLGRKHADKIYCDSKDGQTRHVGYIVAGAWWNIWEVHEWQGKAA